MKKETNTDTGIFYKLNEIFKITVDNITSTIKLSPIQSGIMSIIFILFISSGSLNAIQSNDDSNPITNNFIYYSIQAWSWILIILILYSTFILR